MSVIVTNIVLPVQNIVILVLAVGYVPGDDQFVLYNVDMDTIIADTRHVHHQHESVLSFVNVGGGHKPVSTS
jgi:hypothetical protein